MVSATKTALHACEEHSRTEAVGDHSQSSWKPLSRAARQYQHPAVASASREAARRFHVYGSGHIRHRAHARSLGSTRSFRIWRATGRSRKHAPRSAGASYTGNELKEAALGRANAERVKVSRSLWPRKDQIQPQKFADHLHDEPSPPRTLAPSELPELAQDVLARGAVIDAGLVKFRWNRRHHHSHSAPNQASKPSFS